MLPVRLFLSVIFAYMLFLAAGCSGLAPPPSLDSPTAKNLERIGDAYLRATVQLNRPPASEKELRPFLKEQGKPDQLLVSPVDKEKYVIVWGVELRMMKETGTAIPVVAYERKGDGGKRHVLRGRTDVYTLSEGELRQSVIPPGHSFPF